MTDIVRKDVGRFGTKEPEFKDLTKADVGMPNRLPMLTDRTNFASHLHISSDNNLSGVVGTGIAKAVERSEAQGTDIDDKTAEMVKNVRRNMLGDKMFDDPSLFLAPDPVDNGKAKPKNKLKKIDAETLILADVISKRKGNN